MRAAFHTILVPVDFSPHSRKALEYATTLAQQFGSTVLILYVLVEQQDGETDLSCTDPEEEALQTLQRYALPELQDCKVEFHVGTGRPRDEILWLARREQADLIVMGTHGRTGLAYEALGSITEDIVRTAPCPVFTVRATLSRSTRQSVSIPDRLSV